MAVVAPTLSIEYLKNVELGESLYAKLTNNNDDDIATAKLGQAEGWAEAKFNNGGYTYDTDEFYTAQAVMQMCVYLLYLRNNQHEVGKPYKKMAEESLETAIGNSALSAGNSGSLSNQPAMSVSLSSNQLFTDSSGEGGYGPDMDY